MTVNRKNDFAFKRIFGHEDSKDVLARFLSVVLKTPIEAEELSFIQTELNPEYVADKSSVLDVQVRRSKHHEKMNVEMQRRDEGNIDRRILYYWGRSFSGELKSGQNYSELPRQISIVIADFDVFDWKDPAKFHGKFHIREQEEGIAFSDALEIHILELPKLRKQPITMDALECWLLYLDNMEGEIMEQIAKQEPMIQRAMTIEEAFMKSESDRYLYELREKGRHDYDNAMSTAEKRGMEKGMAKGLEKGLEKAKTEVAKKMLDKSLPMELIHETTGLDMKTIQSLTLES